VGGARWDRLRRDRIHDRGVLALSASAGTTIRLALAQINPTVGDIDGNAARISDAIEAARREGAQLVVLPELAVTGYPPEDLLLRPAFVARAGEALEKIAARTGRAAAVVGFPEAGRDLFNAAAVCANGRVLGVYRKHLLPNYAVFDEQRYFSPSTADGPLFVVAGVRVAVTICEDAWSPTGPILTQAAGGAELVVNLNASPYYAGRLREREVMLATRAADASVPVMYANLVGGQDELVFDGCSFASDASGALVHRAPAFEESMSYLDAAPDSGGGVALSGGSIAPLPQAEESVWRAIVLGVRDYVGKHQFTGVTRSKRRASARPAWRKPAPASIATSTASCSV
jgi:NAD+ synthase (glutamine-hydrolysing)